MRTYWLTLLFFCTAVWLLNYWVDISGVSNKNEIFRLGALQKTGESILSKKEMDHRAWVKGRLEGLTACPEIVALGSSTIGLLSQPMFGEHAFFNAYVPQPSIEDFESIAALLEKKKCRLKGLVIGVDHWLVNRRVERVRWTTLFPEYVRYVMDISMVNKASNLFHSMPSFLMSYWAKVNERLSYSTTRATLRYLLSKRGPSDEPEKPYLSQANETEICNAIGEEFSRRGSDGHGIYCPNFNHSQKEINEAAKNYVAYGLHLIREWKAVDRERISRLGILIEHFTKKNTKVVLIATPFHALTVERFKSSPEINERFKELDIALEGLAEQKKQAYFNSRDPKQLNCDVSNFIDPHHSDHKCTSALAEKIRPILAPTLSSIRF